MKEKYESAKMEIITFETEDIITTSGLMNPYDLNGLQFVKIGDDYLQMKQ